MKTLFLASLALLNASLFAKDPSSCECLLPERPIAPCQCPAAYNLSAAVKSNFYIDVSYTYWYAGEDGLDIGRSGDFVLGDDPFLTSPTTILSQSFGYQSGFKVGAGWRADDWILAGEYTWVSNTHLQNSFAPNDSTLATGVWMVAPWFLQEAGDGGSLSGTEVGSKWHLRMDIADFTLSRPFYQGRHLVILPFGGLRAAWIRQKMDITLTETPGILTPTPPQSIQSSTGSHAWAIGPRFGSEAHVLLGAGFRIEGDIAVSLLFTEYTKIYHSEDPATLPSFPATISVSQKNRTALRPVVETGLGIGWGSYSYCGKFHIDFSADYDFAYWWDQNMMRNMLSVAWRETSTNGDLYLHGLTITARFGF